MSTETSCQRWSVTGSWWGLETACCRSACRRTQHSHLRRRRQLFASVKQYKSNSSSCPTEKMLISSRQSITWWERRSGDMEQYLTGRQHRGHFNKHLRRVNATQASVSVWKGPHPRQQCPAKDAVCYNCRKKGHCSGQCLSKSSRGATKVSEIITTEDPSVAYLSTIGTREEISWLTTVAVNSEPMKFKVDTGAEVTALTEEAQSRMAPWGPS